MESLQNKQIFAEICGFYQQFAKTLELQVPDFEELQNWLLDEGADVPDGLVNVLRRLMNKHHMMSSIKVWQTKLIEFCDNHYPEAAVELKVVGSYSKLAFEMRMEILRVLQDTLFDSNRPLMRFVEKEPEKLRAQQLGQDIFGRRYFMFAPPHSKFFEFYYETQSIKKCLIAKNCDELKSIVKGLKRFHGAPPTRNRVAKLHFEEKQLITLLNTLAECLY